MSHSVHKAVIPTAGRGTRLFPVTETVPKELLPVGSVPVLHRAIAEAVRGGMDQLAIIERPDKPLVRTYIEHWQTELGCDITFFSQTEPRGVADAILLTADWIGEEPFLFFMPDEVCFCPQSPIARLGEVYDQTNQSVLVLTTVPSDWSQYFQGTGRIVTEHLGADLYQVQQLKEKTRKPFTPGDSSNRDNASGNTNILKGVGIGVLDGEFLALAKHFQQQHQQSQSDQEFDDVPIWQELVRRGQLLGVEVEGVVVDAGNDLGLGLANQHWLAEGRFLEIEARLPSPRPGKTGDGVG